MGEESDWKEFCKAAVQCSAFCDINYARKNMRDGVWGQDISVIYKGSFNNEKY
jgi:hypothetical protein